MKHKMKNILPLLLVFFYTLSSAQGSNNKNCPYNIDYMVRSRIGDIVIYSYIIDIYPDSTICKNYIANSDSYFDSILSEVNGRKMHVANIEYSSTDMNYQKVFSYDYMVKSRKIKGKKYYSQFPAHCIGYPKDRDWLEGYFSKVLTENLYIKFYEQTLRNYLP